MTYSLSSVQTKTSNRPVSNITIAVATIVGAALGAASMGLAGGSLGLSSPVNNGLRSISTRSTDYTNAGDGVYYNGQYYASLSDLCVAPSSAMNVGSGGGGAAAPASMISAPMPGKGGGGAEEGAGGGGQGGGGGTNVITKLIGGSTANTQASMSYTGPNSTNEIKTINKTTTTVTNDNHIQVTNNNSQTAKTGSAEVEGNTSGGTAASGDAANSSDANFNVSVTN